MIAIPIGIARSINEFSGSLQKRLLDWLAPPARPARMRRHEFGTSSESRRSPSNTMAAGATTRRRHARTPHRDAGVREGFQEIQRKRTIATIGQCNRNRRTARCGPPVKWAHQSASGSAQWRVVRHADDSRCIIASDQTIAPSGSFANKSKRGDNE